jgi:hypothetical protein
MECVFVFFFLSAVGGIMGLLIVNGVWAERADKAACAAAYRRAAEETGWPLQENPPPDCLEPLGHLGLFSQGDKRQARYLMSGTVRGRAVCVLDYGYVLPGRRGAASDHTVVCFHLPGAALPHFCLQPRTVLATFFNDAFGDHEIDCSRHPEFTRGYILWGPKASAVRRLFMPEVFNYFEEARPKLEAEGRGDWLVLFRRREFGKTKEATVCAFLDEALPAGEVIGRAAAKDRA